MSETSQEILKLLRELLLSELYDGASLEKVASDGLHSAYEAVALFMHSAMLFAGFRLVGLGESGALTSTGNNWPLFDCGDLKGVSALPKSWNHSTDLYAFRYKHPQSSMTFLLKILKMGATFVVNGLALEDGKIYEIRLKVEDYAKLAVFPLKSVQLDALKGALFGSKELFKLLKDDIVKKLIPGLLKPGFEHLHAETSTQTEPESSGHGSSRRIPPVGRVPFPRPTGTIPDYYSERPGRSPYGIGDRDLDPFGSLRPPHPGGGMLVGPDHPMFGVGPEGIARPPDSMFPPGAVPPGARFDPVFPGQRPPMPGRPFRPFRPPRSGEPDNDEFYPPGNPDYFL